MAHIRKQVITLYMTTRCNLKCRYCYTYRKKDIKEKDQVLDLAFAKRGIADFFRDSPSRHIRFYGIGEPTLEFGLMKEIADYARQKAGKKLTVELQTNGIFSDKIAQWVSENVDILWISCDGPPNIQDTQRPTTRGGGSSYIVEKHLRHFSNINNIQVGVRATLTAPMISRQIDLINYFDKLGIKYVGVHPACDPVEDRKNEDIFGWDPIEFAANFLNAYNEAAKRGIFYSCLYISYFVLNFF